MTAAVAAHPWLLITGLTAIAMVAFVTAVVLLVPGGGHQAPGPWTRSAARATRAARRALAAARRLPGATVLPRFHHELDGLPDYTDYEVYQWALELAHDEYPQDVPGREPPGPPLAPVRGGRAPAAAPADAAHPAGDPDLPETHYSPAATERALAGDIHGTLACGSRYWQFVTDQPDLVTCEPCKATIITDSPAAGMVAGENPARPIRGHETPAAGAPPGQADTLDRTPDTPRAAGMASARGALPPGPGTPPMPLPRDRALWGHWHTELIPAIDVPAAKDAAALDYMPRAPFVLWGSDTFVEGLTAIRDGA